VRRPRRWVEALAASAALIGCHRDSLQPACSMGTVTETIGGIAEPRRVFATSDAVFWSGVDGIQRLLRGEAAATRLVDQVDPDLVAFNGRRFAWAVRADPPGAARQVLAKDVAGGPLALIAADFRDGGLALDEAGGAWWTTVDGSEVILWTRTTGAARQVARVAGAAVRGLLLDAAAAYLAVDGSLLAVARADGAIRTVAASLAAQIGLLAQDGSSLWLGGAGGLFQVAKSGGSPAARALGNAVAAVPDGQRTYWIEGGPSGAVHLLTATADTRVATDVGSPAGMAMDESRVYFGTWSGSRGSIAALCKF